MKLNEGMAQMLSSSWGEKEEQVLFHTSYFLRYTLFQNVSVYGIQSFFTKSPKHIYLQCWQQGKVLDSSPKHGELGTLGIQVNLSEHRCKIIVPTLILVVTRLILVVTTLLLVVTTLQLVVTTTRPGVTPWWCPGESTPEVISWQTVPVSWSSSARFNWWCTSSSTISWGKQHTK